jgi:hypothetical protein
VTIRSVVVLSAVAGMSVANAADAFTNGAATYAASASPPPPPPDDAGDDSGWADIGARDEIPGSSEGGGGEEPPRCT